MLCENCKSAEATTHIKSTINGTTKEYFLCPNCASKLGFGEFGFFNDLDDFFGPFFNNGAKIQNNLKRCKTCNTSFNEIIESGKMGCPDCYMEFRDEIIPSLKKIHGKIDHKGITPETSVNSSDNKIEKLENELKEAIENEEFEKAAKIRDELKEMRKQNG